MSKIATFHRLLSLNQVILKDSQPCIINYLTNLKEIIDFVLDKFVEAELQAR